MVLSVYLTGLFVTIMFDLTLDISVKETVFNKKWFLEMILSCVFWPITIIANISMALFLRSKNKYTFSVKSNEN